MADDLRSPPELPSNSSKQSPVTTRDHGFHLGVAVGICILPTICAFHMLKARWESKPLEFLHTYRSCCNLRRPPICTASVSLFRATVEEKPADIAQAKHDPVEMDT